MSFFKRTFIATALSISMLVPLVSSADTASDLQALIAQLQAQIAALQAQVNSLSSELPPAGGGGGGGGSGTGQTTSAISCPAISRNLYLGLKGADVTALQQFLRELGYFTYLTNTGYFGPSTEKAVQMFQSAEGIVSSGDAESTGYGVVGAQTREAITKKCAGGGSIPPSTPPATPQPTQPQTLSIADVVGVQSSYVPGQQISFSVKGINNDGTPVSSSEGFNVQAYIYNSDHTKTYSGVNGTFNPKTNLWNVSLVAPSDTSIPYHLQVILYCSNGNLCGSPAALDQVEKTYKFTLGGNKIQQSIKVIYPNGGEQWQVGSSQTVKWTDANLSSSDTIGIIRLRNSAGVEFTLVQNTANDGQEIVAIPSNLQAGTYTLEVKSMSSVLGISEKFSIVAPTTSDTTAPKVSIVSPSMGSTVPNTGFTMSIDASDDNSGVKQVLVRAYDRGTAQWIVGSGSDFANAYPPKGTTYWSYNVQGQLTVGNSVWIQAKAIDNAGNEKQSLAWDVKVVQVAVTQPSIIVISPNGGEQYIAGEGSININYKSANISGKELDVFLYSPTLGNVRSFKNVASDEGTIEIALAKGGADPIGQYKVGLCATYVDNPAVPGKPLCDYSDNYFNLVAPANQPSITVTSPNGGEQYISGNTYNGTFQWSGFSTQSIVVYLNNQQNGSVLISKIGAVGSGSSAGDKLFSFTIPSNTASGSDYKIGVCEDYLVSSSGDKGVCGWSNIFSVVGTTSTSDTTAPKVSIVSPSMGSMVPNTGFTMSIDASDDNSGVKQVLVRAYDRGTAQWIVGSGSDFANAYPPKGTTYWSYNVQGQLTVGNSVWIQAKAIDNAGNEKQSLAWDVKVVQVAVTQPSITVISPNGGTTWKKGNALVISWTSTGINQAYVKLRKNSLGDTIRAVADNLQGQGTHYWTIPSDLPDGDDYVIRILDQNSPNTFSDSEPFSIVAPTTQSAGTLTARIDSGTSGSLAYRLVSPGQNVELIKIKYSATNEDIDVKRVALQLSNTGLNSPIDLVGQEVSLWDGSTQVGTAVFNATTDTAISTLNIPIRVPNGGSKILTVKGTIAPINISGPMTRSGDWLIVDYDGNNVGLSGNYGVGVSSGIAISASSNDTTSNGVRIMKEYPIIETIPLSSSEKTLMTGSQRILYTFKVSSGAGGEIAIGKFTFKINSNGATIQNPKLYAFTDSSFSSPDTNFNSSSNPNGLLNQIGTNVGADGIVEIRPYGSIEYISGSVKYFKLVGDIQMTGGSAIATVQLEGDGAYPNVSNMGTFSTINDDLNNDFIWSPVSITSPNVNNLDWTNGYGVRGLPSTNTSIETLTGFSSTPAQTYKKLDVDQNGATDANDLNYISRRLMGFLPSTTASAELNTQLSNRIDALGASLNVDGVGGVSASTDITYINRYITNQAPTVPDSWRTSSADIPSNEIINGRIETLKNTNTTDPNPVYEPNPTVAPKSVSLATDNKSGTAPLAVNFTATLNNFPSCGNSHVWNYGDGNSEGVSESCAGGVTTIQSRTITANHTYQSAGTYNVQLTVNGNVVSNTVSVVVSNPVVQPTEIGPVITYFGIANADGSIAPTETLSDGTLVFNRVSGKGFIVIVEARNGSSGLNPGSSLSSTGDPSLQMISDKPLGSGGAYVCGTGTDGVPAVPSLLFSDASINVLRDMVCRFSSGSAVTKNKYGNYAYISSGTRRQYYHVLSSYTQLPNGQVKLKARVKDTSGNLGPEKTMIINVGSLGTTQTTQYTASIYDALLQQLAKLQEILNSLR